MVHSLHFCPGSILSVPSAPEGVSDRVFPVTTGKKRLFWFNVEVGSSVALSVPLISLRQSGILPVSFKSFARKQAQINGNS